MKMMVSRKKPVKVGFIALGCPKNIVDSERMLAEIAQSNCFITADSYGADAVVINTCGFIEPAKQEAIAAIKKAVAAKKKGKVKKVIVAGCLPERLKEKLFEETEGIDAIVCLANRDSIADIIREVISSDDKLVFSGKFNRILPDRQRLLIGPKHRAFLRISEGCDRCCSFCTIPAIRGLFRSKPLDMIIAEAKELAGAGVKEISIISQDTTSYGRDLKIKDGLVTLLKEIEKIDNLVWIRLMYLHPAAITDNLLETIAESKKIVHYLDIPIQHISSAILKKMLRPGSKEKISDLFEKIRNVLPDAVLRTTLIVGFPGETDGQFEELLEFVRQVRFDALGAFKYYPEEGTKSAALPNQVSEIIKEQRLDTLMLTQQRIAFAKNKEMLGKRLLCLVDKIDKKNCIGRYYGQAPDIDSICIIKNCTSNPGEFINTKVIGPKGYDLIVEQL
jgi:ribosomal protein S12 methylthiotransferase